MERIHYELPIYPFQIDFMRHVSNIVYIQWMEVGRCLLLDAVGLSVAQTGEQGFVPALVETQISYKKPLRLGDRVLAQVWLSELSQASAWMDFEFRNGANEMAATGRQRGLFIDSESGRPRRMSPEDRARFVRFLDDGAGPASVRAPGGNALQRFQTAAV
jgi:acyl-CoA thioester hydrolase